MEFDFKKWLANIDFDEYIEIYALYCSVRDLDDQNYFKCTKQGDAFIVQCSHMKDYPLRLASEAARSYFLEYMEKQYCDDMSMDAWYAFKRAMEKND